MTTLTVTTCRRVDDRTSAAAIDDLEAAHLDVAARAAELDFDDATTWDMAGPVIAAVAAAAYETTAALTGQSPTALARRVPPVVRTRELVFAQRQLSRTLRADGLPRPAMVEHVRTAAARVRRMTDCLDDLTRSGLARSR